MMKPSIVPGIWNYMVSIITEGKRCLLKSIPGANLPEGSHKQPILSSLTQSLRICLLRFHWREICQNVTGLDKLLLSKDILAIPDMMSELFSMLDITINRTNSLSDIEKHPDTNAS